MEHDSGGARLASLLQRVAIRSTLKALQDDHIPSATQLNGTNEPSSTWALLVRKLLSRSEQMSMLNQSDNFQDNASWFINWPKLLLAIFFLLIMLSTAIGNLFVIFAILLERNLRTVGNYLVLSLAIADLLVACLVMPLASIYKVLDTWTLGIGLCDVWTSADVFCCTGE